MLYVHYLVKLKHQISYFYNVLLEQHLLYIKYRENKLIVTTYVQKCPPLA